MRLTAMGLVEIKEEYVAATATQQFSLRDYNYNTSQSSTAQYKRTSMHKQETKYEIENINTSVFVVR